MVRGSGTSSRAPRPGAVAHTRKREDERLEIEMLTRGSTCGRSKIDFSGHT